MISPAVKKPTAAGSACRLTANSNPVSLRDVARAARVSVGTASQALRDRGDTSVATRNRVKEVAERLGYSADPTLSHTMTYLKRRRRHKRFEPIAFVAGEGFDLLPRHSTARLKYEGALERAHELGYRLQLVEWRKLIERPQAVASRLHNIGVRGVLIGSQPTAQETLDWDWRRFVPVALSTTVSHPRTTRIMGHHYQMMRLVVSRLRGYGYRRIGLTLSPATLERSDRLWLAGYKAFVDRSDGLIPLPELVQDFCASDFLNWFRRNRPDVILDAQSCHHDALTTAGYEVPGDCALVALDPTEDDSPVTAHLDHHAREVGRAAVNYLSEALERKEFGMPARPRDILIPGSWVDGDSAPDLLASPATRTGKSPFRLEKPA